MVTASTLRARIQQVKSDLARSACSRVVYENIKNKDGLSATLLGERNLKNVSTPIVLYTLNPSAPSEPTTPARGL